MSLDTVLQIGKTLRSSKKGLKHFKYIKPCPSDTDKETILRINIPVTEGITFDWDRVSIVPENQIDELFYLTFKTSDADSLVKYIFGDIYYELTSKVKRNGEIDSGEGGFYRVSNEEAYGAYKKSSFQRAENDFESLQMEIDGDDLILNDFRDSFREDELKIEKILNNIPAVTRFFSTNREKPFKEFISNDKLIEKYFVENILQVTNSRTLQKAFGNDFDGNNLRRDEVERIKKVGSGKVFLHFDFSDKHWYEFNSELDLITKKMLDDFFEESKHGNVLKKSLYKTLCSGDMKNDAQFPGFDHSSKHKSFNFSDEQAKDLFYAKEYAEKALFTIRGTEIKVIVLPKGENLNASDYEQFMEKANEKRLIAANRENKSDEEPIFVPMVLDNDFDITAFDFVFSKYSQSGPDRDLIEISGIEKSNLKRTIERINDIGNKIKKKYSYEYKPKIEQSFVNILGSAQADLSTGKVSFKPNPKYQSHILKVLPKVYSCSYYQDEILFPALIEKVQFSIRAGSPNFKSLKYCLEFLLRIQNNQINRYMEITKSKSYQVGLLLGSLSKDLKHNINSFEKNYVGNLTRRISTLQDCIKFKNQIEEKNIMHDISKYKRSISSSLSEMIQEMDESEYDKEQVAFGFFENYFKYENKKSFIEKLEKLLTDYSTNEDEADNELVEQINNTLQNYQTK